MKYKVHFADDIELMLRGDNKLKDVTSSLTGWRTETNIAKESHVNTNGVVNGEELQKISSFNNLSGNLFKDDSFTAEICARINTDNGRTEQELREQHL